MHLPTNLNVILTFEVSYLCSERSVNDLYTFDTNKLVFNWLQLILKEDCSKKFQKRIFCKLA